MNPSTLFALAGAAAWAVLFGTAHAGDPSPYPTRPVRLIVPTVPGPPPDVVARLLGERLAALLRQPVVVDNRPGAIGTIGLAMVRGRHPMGIRSASLRCPM
jgi:tripartite-type tricarboxylate transporter receptor subunit TctC